MLTIVADDLTGACDTGTLFAGRSSVPLAIWPRAPSPGEVRVIDTESRARAAGESARRVLSAVARAPATHLFKKIDSTLRGRIGAEVEALMSAAGVCSALVCPAFPAQGRVVVDRVLLVRGTPVSATTIGLDPEFPEIPATTRLRVPDMLELLRPQFQRPLAWLPLDVVRGDVKPLVERLSRLSDRVVFADAETDSDLEALVAAALGGRSKSYSSVRLGWRGRSRSALAFSPNESRCHTPGVGSSWRAVSIPSPAARPKSPRRRA